MTSPKIASCARFRRANQPKTGTTGDLAPSGSETQPQVLTFFSAASG